MAEMTLSAPIAATLLPGAVDGAACGTKARDAKL